MHLTSYILTYRCAGDAARRANLETVLRWLQALPLAEVIVVEQDLVPTLGDMAAHANRRVLFAYNPGPFNKAWGYNVGARMAQGNCLVFADADTLCRSLPQAVAQCRAGAPVVRAFKGLIDLDEAQSAELREDLSCLHDPSFASERPADRSGIGERLPLCCGVVVFQRAFFELLGGWDERFLGWGGEDDAMDVKLQRAGVQGLVLDQRDGFHLHHRRANGALADDPNYRMNLALLQQLRTMPEPELKRLCEVAWQVAGYRDMHAPMEALP